MRRCGHRDKHAAARPNTEGGEPIGARVDRAKKLTICCNRVQEIPRRRIRCALSRRCHGFVKRDIGIGKAWRNVPIPTQPRALFGRLTPGRGNNFSGIPRHRRPLARLLNLQFNAREGAAGFDDCQLPLLEGLASPGLHAAFFASGAGLQDLASCLFPGAGPLLNPKYYKSARLGAAEAA